MKYSNFIKNVEKICLIITMVAAFASCGGSQNDSDQAATEDTGAVAFKILFEHPGDADRTIQSLDTCDDVGWVKASVVDENGTVLKEGVNWPCENRSGTLSGVPAGDRRRAVVYGIDPDGETILYWGVSDVFTVSPAVENAAGTITAKPIADADQDGDGYTPNGGDCADTDKNIHPDANDLCNDEIDQDCDPDSCPVNVWYGDQDNDGYGDLSDTITRVQCPDHYVANSLDCNDADGNISPKAAEQCNGIDDNCDGIKDEGCPWSKTFDGGGDDQPVSIIQTSDSGYLIAESVSFDSEPDATVIRKIDELGVEQWTFKLGAGEDNYGSIHHVTKSIDSGFIITGNKDDDVWLMKIDEQGESILLNDILEGLSSIYVLQSTDGGYVFVDEGVWESDDGYYPTYSLYKTDSNGVKMFDVLFEVEYNLSLASVLFESLIQTDDSGYLLAGSIGGTTHSSSLSGRRPYLIKINGEGEEIWRATINEAPGSCKAVFQSDDDGYIVAGQAEVMYSTSINIIKINSQGEYQGHKEIVATGQGVNFSSMAKTNDGGYIIAGNDNYDEMEIDPDVWVIKTDKDFNIEWKKTFGGDLDDSAPDVIPSVDGGYAILVKTNSYGLEDYDCLVIKTDAEGNAPLIP